jgi:hypothetical protein
MTRGPQHGHEEEREHGSAAFFSPIRADDPRAFPTLPGLAPVRTVGRGAHATVWLAREGPPLAREVAVKVLDAGCGGGESLERFRREWNALARAAGEGVAAALGAGMAPDGRAYLVMEFVDGEPIVEACESRSLGLSQRLELVAQLCDIVARIHAAGIVHRDLKPSNVLVSFAVSPPRVTLLDFGVARVSDADHALTDGGMPLGTPEWMAPEQTGLAPDAAGPGADLWAIGLLIERLWTGRAPFSRGDGSADAVRKLLGQVARAERTRVLPPEPRSNWDDLGAAARERLAALVGRLGAREPDARGSSVADVAAEIRAIAASATGPDRGGGARRTLARTAVRIGVGVAALGAAVHLWGREPALEREPVPATGLRALAFGRDDDARCALPGDARFVAIAAGTDFTLAVRADGAVIGAGHHARAVAEIPAEVAPGGGARAIEVAAREQSGAALLTDGRAVCWGYRSTCAVCDRGPLRQIDARRTALLAVATDGALSVDSPAPGGMVSLPQGGGFVRVAVGHKTAAAARASGELAVWGSDATGIVTAANGLRVREFDFAGRDSPSSMLGWIELDGRVRIVGGDPPRGLPPDVGEWRAAAIAGADGADWFAISLSSGGIRFVGAVPESVARAQAAVTERVVRIDAGPEHLVLLAR